MKRGKRAKNGRIKALKQGKLIALLLVAIFLVPLVKNWVSNAAFKNEDIRKEIPSYVVKQEVPSMLDEWSLVFVNPDNYLDDDFKIDLEKVQGNYMMDSRAADITRQMIADAKADGVHIQICSAYRNIQKQKSLYYNKIEKYKNEGNSSEEAECLASKEVAVPGTSEHHTGLAIDIIARTYQTLDEHIENTDVFKWMDKNAHKYGFIMRYPKNKQDITKIIYEPWHYRYVGTEHASIMKKENLCFEEYIDLLKSIEENNAYFKEMKVYINILQYIISNK